MFFENVDFVIEELKKEKNYCKFSISPLFKGFGITIGNSLRRILLNSLPGTSIFAVEIKGVVHEFSTIPGVVEDVTQIIFNLRKVVLRNFANTDEVIRLQIDKKGPGKVLAKDINCVSKVEVVNPDLEIANLNEDSRLEMFLYVRSGLGYATAEVNKIDNKLIGKEHGVIYVDSNYSSILMANYNVEPVRVENQILEKLFLEVKTNGLYTPQQAVANAANILISHLNKFVNVKDKLVKINFKKEAKSDETKKDSNNEKAIEELELGTRATHCLKRAGIKTINDLANMSPSKIKEIRHLGKKTAVEVFEKMEELGIKFRDEF